MAKRRPKQLTPEEQHAALMKRRNLLLGILWTFVTIIAVLFGYSHGYPLVAAGQTIQGILVGLAYGVGALLAIMVAFFLNRKLRGL
jgi:predicted MFS family arabinose efflux permease